jgi:SpoIID/LytB domain protein
MKGFEQEPKINVGIMDGVPEVSGLLNKPFALNNQSLVSGGFRAAAAQGTVVMTKDTGEIITRAPRVHLQGNPGATFGLRGVTIGKLFHWERPEDHVFSGNLILEVRKNSTIVAINEVPVEDYLGSVISSEMNAQAPTQFLLAHAILSRSWLLATLEKKRSKSSSDNKKGTVPGSKPRTGSPAEIIRWYDGEDHDLFDVCADDHCQRYHGITKITSGEALRAVKETRGRVLAYGESICDARYSKACGGHTDVYSTAWDDVEIPYLTHVCDSPLQGPPISSEEEAERWINSTPEAFCHTTDEELLSRILPSFDRETETFFRWTVVYPREELSEIIREKSGIDFGTVKALVPLSRGPSGRIYRLLVKGTKEEMVVGKELEIRRWLSRSHLYSSAFTVETKEDGASFLLHGAGWGHGVGLCQIGAAVMASKGFRAAEILKHYFRGAKIVTVY